MSKKTEKKESKAKVETLKPTKIQKFFTWCGFTLLKLFIVLVLTLIVYSIYLDGKVRHKFEGNKWEIPVQVYAKAETLTLGQRIDLKVLAETLDFSRYQRVTRVSQPGEYAMSASRIIIYRREFSFDNAMQMANKITVDVNNQKISRIDIANKSVKSIQIDPILMDRILSNSKEDRVLTPLGNIPELLLDTLLLIEDRNFYFHSGVSPMGILRALYSNIRAGRTVQGGSTLTQQLVKNMFLTRKKTLWRKANEALMSLLLEYRYSKDQLLEAYINEVYLGQNYANAIHGFGLASQFYFNESIEHLTIEQIAMLVGIVKGPSFYDAWRKPENTIKRRDLVLKLMFENEYISKNEYVEAVESSLTVRKKRKFTKQKFPSYIQLVNHELTDLLNDYDRTSGVFVFTGFSHYSQLLLEKTIQEKLPQLDKVNEKLQAAMIVSDIESGEIKAMIGGNKKGYEGFNRALNANRSIGSLIKPVIYISALERYEQYTLATVLEDKPISLASGNGNDWKPKNYDGKYRNKVSLLDALVESLNVPTVNLGMELGLSPVAEVIHLLGFERDIVTRPSMLLGAINMSPFEVNQLYLPIAAKGYRKRGHAVTSVVSSNGETLWEVMPSEEQLFSKQAVYLLDYALSDVTTRGTAKSLTWRLKNKKTAGKTGTTNDQRDSWYIGYDDKHLVTTWVGRDDNQPTQHTGSSGALVLFADFMAKQGVNNKALLPPEGVVETSFEVETGNAVFDNCSATILLPAITKGIEALETCQQPAHKQRTWLERIFSN